MKFRKALMIAGIAAVFITGCSSMNDRLEGVQMIVAGNEMEDDAPISQIAWGNHLLVAYTCQHNINEELPADYQIVSFDSQGKKEWSIPVSGEFIPVDLLPRDEKFAFVLLRNEGESGDFDVESRIWMIDHDGRIVKEQLLDDIRSWIPTQLERIEPGRFLAFAHYEREDGLMMKECQLNNDLYIWDIHWSIGATHLFNLGKLDLFGVVRSSDEKQADFQYTRIDNQGQSLWAKTYQELGLNLRVVGAMSTGERETLVCANSLENGTGVFVSFSGDGEILWKTDLKEAKLFGQPVHMKGSKYQVAASVTKKGKPCLASVVVDAATGKVLSIAAKSGSDFEPTLGAVRLEDGTICFTGVKYQRFQNDLGIAILPAAEMKCNGGCCPAE